MLLNLELAIQICFGEVVSETNIDSIFFFLQPAVEAFFLVHAPPSTERERERSSNSGSRANPSVDLVPDVPAPRVTAQPQTPGQVEVPNVSAVNTSGEEASPASMALESATPAPTLTPDQQKFLKFAGKNFQLFHVPCFLIKRISE